MGLARLVDKYGSGPAYALDASSSFSTGVRAARRAAPSLSQERIQLVKQALTRSRAPETSLERTEPASRPQQKTPEEKIETPTLTVGQACDAISDLTMSEVPVRSQYRFPFYTLLIECLMLSRFRIPCWCKLLQ